MRESPIITEHRAPFRIWRTVAILSVILFLAVCVWAYVTITNMKHTTILGAFTGCLLLLALVTHSIFAWVLFGMLGIGWLGKLAERDLK